VPPSPLGANARGGEAARRPPTMATWRQRGGASAGRRFTGQPQQNAILFRRALSNKQATNTILFY